MTDVDLIIRPLQFSEIDLTRDLPPVEWKFDMPAFFRFHFTQSYFYVIVAVKNKTVVGTGNIIWTKKVAWLGNIIVHPENRNKGIGTKLTENLIEFGKSRGCSSIVLVATAMGGPLYRKLGFKTVSSYIFYTDGNTFDYDPDAKIREMNKSDLAAVLKLDYKITGENRKTFFQRYLQTGWVHYNKSGQEIDGFYLPKMDNGLIIADNENAGLELLKFRNQKVKEITVLPVENKAAGKLLLEKGYAEKLIIPRMVLGKEIPWKPQLIFSRATGYSG